MADSFLTSLEAAPALEAIAGDIFSNCKEIPKKEQVNENADGFRNMCSELNFIADLALVPFWIRHRRAKESISILVTYGYIIGCDLKRYPEVNYRNPVSIVIDSLSP